MENINPRLRVHVVQESLTKVEKHVVAFAFASSTIQLNHNESFWSVLFKI